MENIKIINELYKNKRYEEALSLIDTMLKEEKNEIILLFLKSNILYDLNSIDSSIQCLKKLINLLKDTIFDYEDEDDYMYFKTYAVSLYNLSVMYTKINETKLKYITSKLLYSILDNYFAYMESIEEDIRIDLLDLNDRLLNDFDSTENIILSSFENSRKIFVLYYKSKNGFFVYDNTNKKDELIEFKQCKSKYTKLYKKLKEDLINYYDIKYFISDGKLKKI